MDLYKTLHIDKSATSDDIKNAYRSLSKVLHPDVNNGNDKGFIELNLAYRILCDSQKRKLYDEQGIILDESPSHIQNLIQDRMTKIANGWLDNMIRGNKINLQAFVMSSFNKLSGGIEDTNEKIKLNIKALKGIKKRLKSKSNNVIHNVIDHRITTYNKAIHQNETKLAIIDQLKVIMDEYEYEEEEDLYEVMKNATSLFSTQGSFSFRNI